MTVAVFFYTRFHKIEYIYKWDIDILERNHLTEYKPYIV